jgi:hypothetical protein
MGNPKSKLSITYSCLNNEVMAKSLYDLGQVIVDLYQKSPVIGSSLAKKR